MPEAVVQKATGTGTGDGLPGDANYLEDVQTQYDWQLALTRIIAEAWNDPKLWATLTDSNTTAAEVRAIFLDRVNYALPNGVNVTFQEVAVEYLPQTSVNGWAAGLKELSANVVVKLPPAPEAKLQAKAIADYVATGKAYPFT